MRSQPAVRDGYALFWGQWPSNWMPSEMLIDGVTYNCVEQWMMAEKARLFGDHETLALIMANPDPETQKALGRRVRGFVEETWVQQRYPIVLKGTLAKYRQNAELRQYLLALGNVTFVEASPDDRIWGIGMHKAHPDATNPDKWRGLNLLGKAVTEVRDILRAEATPGT